MSEYSKAKKRVHVSPGESVRIVRELQELSQKELSRATHIPQSTLSAIEKGLVALSIDRAKTLARVLKCHPAVLVFPRWDITKESYPDIPTHFLAQHIKNFLGCH